MSAATPVRGAAAWPPGQRARCRVRENRGGRYFSLVYGNPCALHPDPIEKKPFFHVRPGTTSYFVATAGCNFHCKFCRNREISQAAPEDLFNHDVPPYRAVQNVAETCIVAPCEMLPSPGTTTGG